MQRWRDPLPFEGDDEPDTNGLRLPLAWTLIWRGTYSNLRALHIGRHLPLGYVMWDAARGRCWRGSGRRSGGDGDPRNDL